MDKQDRPVKVSVLVDREEGTVPELLNQIAEIVSVKVENILLASVNDHAIWDVVYPWSKIQSVNDVMFAYELIGPPALPQDIEGPSDNVVDSDIWTVRVLHRKVHRSKIYFISPNTVALFSSPSILSFKRSTITNRILYDTINQKFAFMLNNDVLSNKTESSEFQFTLKMVNSYGTSCPRSPWYTYNIGTLIPIDDNTIDLANGDSIAVDWKPEIYLLKHLRINYPHGDWFDEHQSVKENWEKLNAPISLDQCMSWFTQEEALSDELFCKNCQKPEKTTKKMEIWRSPHFLIIHLKRFSFYNNRWIKSNRLVNFPLVLDPSKWLVDPPELPLLYDLYACVNHYGRMGGGHYTAFAVNKDDQKWYNFDDSFVKVVDDEEQIVTSAAYLLFYKLRAVDSSMILKGDPENTLDIEQIVGRLPQKSQDGASGGGEPDPRGLFNPISNNCIIS